MKKITFLSALLLSSLTFSQELLLNGGFENWDSTTEPTSFTKKENVEQESTTVHSGTYSAKHTGGTKDIGQTIAITPGNSYTITLWYKVESGTGDGTDARIWSYWKNGSTNLSGLDDDGQLRGPDNSYLDNNNNAWTKYEVTVTAPADATDFYFEVRTYSKAITYWDDFSFYDNGSKLSISKNTIEGLIVSSSNGTITTNKGEIVTVYNVLGQKVSNEDLTSGIYVVLVKEGSITASEKVYVQ